MIGTLRIELANQSLKRKYEQALERRGVKTSLLDALPYMVDVRDNILRIIPLISYECHIPMINWDCSLGLFETVRNVALPANIEVLDENKDVHLMLVALVAQHIDQDKFVKGLKLNHNFDQVPCKFLPNYLTGGLVFKRNVPNSNDESITFAEFLTEVRGVGP